MGKMARPSMAAPRNLSLTEELEKLEQSITLTLQEIDSNFAKAHRIVTTSILPVVDRYAKHSEAVWAGSEFWKRFFEASANVSLSNYAEPAIDESSVNPDAENSNLSITEELLSSPMKNDDDGDDTITSPLHKVQEDTYGDMEDDDPLLTSPSMPHNRSTPRQPSTVNITDKPSPFEAIRRQMRDDKGPSTSSSTKAPETHSTTAPVTPGKRPPALPNMTMSSLTPAGSSPFTHALQDTAAATQQLGGQRNKDTILHQGILGHTYRTKATPLAAARQRHNYPYNRSGDQQQSQQQTTHTRRHLDLDSSPLPNFPEPQLRAEIFSSPLKAAPGKSVATPARRQALEKWRLGRRRSSNNNNNNNNNKDGGKASRPVYHGSLEYDARSNNDDDDNNNNSNNEEQEQQEDDFEMALARDRLDAAKKLERTAAQSSNRSRFSRWASDDEDDDGVPKMSPPKTMRFEFGHGVLIQTPAREASKQIVQDLVHTAGGDLDQDLPEYSPSIDIKYHDDTFRQKLK